MSNTNKKIVKGKTPKIINEDAVKQLAEMIAPAVTIFTDDEVKDAFSTSGTTIAEAVTVILKKFPTEIVKILAARDGIAYEDAEFTATQILSKTLAMFSDPELMGFFSSLVPRVR